jgi:hypothetical protein
MTEREPATPTLRSLTPEQFLAQFADGPDDQDPDHERRRPIDSRVSGPVEDSSRDGDEARPDGDEPYRLSAQFAVPETATRPPLPPTPSAAGRDRKIPPIPPRSVLQLSNEGPADS